MNRHSIIISSSSIVISSSNIIHATHSFWNRTFFIMPHEAKEDKKNKCKLDLEFKKANSNYIPLKIVAWLNRWEKMNNGRTKYNSVMERRIINLDIQRNTKLIYMYWALRLNRVKLVGWAIQILMSLLLGTNSSQVYSGYSAIATAMDWYSACALDWAAIGFFLVIQEIC